MKRGEKIGLGIAVLAGVLSIFFDARISQFVASLRGFIPDFFFVGFTFEMQTLVVLFFLTSLFLFGEHKRRWILPLWLTAGLSVAISYAFKVFVLRPRPFEAGVTSILSIAYNMLGSGANAWNASFPSFQAVLAFSALPILDREFRRFKWVWFAIACLIGFSRVYFGVHYASDVILGAVIGYLLGFFVVKFEEEHNFGERWLKGINKVIKKTRKALK